MKTVNELKKAPQHVLRDLIHLEVNKEILQRIKELNAAHLKRHPKLESVPDSMRESYKQLALHFVIGGLEALLKITICDLKDVEIALERTEDELKNSLKMSI